MGPNQTGGDENISVLNIPLKSLRIDIKLKRQLLNSGFMTLGEVFAKSPKYLDCTVGQDVTDSILSMINIYKKHPEALKKMLLPSQSRKEHKIQDAEEVIRSVTMQTPSIPQHAHHEQQRIRYIGHLPICRESDALREFEKRVHSTIKIIADHSEDAFLAEALEMNTTEIPKLRLNIQSIFERSRKCSHSSSSIGAVHALAHEVPDSFLLYMLDSAQRNFTGNSVWKQAFAELGIKDNLSEQEIPKLLYERIRNWGFRTYSEEETEFRYYYTVLLHAGLAESDWISIWSRLILPLAKDINRGRLPNGTYPTTNDLIELSSDKMGGYYLANKSASNLLDKAPEVTGPLLFSALGVAENLVASASRGNNSMMMSSNNLPSLAMEALRTVLSSDSTPIGNSNRSLVYLPPAELRLDTVEHDRPLVLHWNETRLPMSYVGRKVWYTVNGIPMATRTVLTGVSYAILEAVTIKVEPAGTYDVEVEMSNPEGSKTNRLFSSQTFRKNRPGIYEFIRSSDGIIRQKIRPLRRKRDVYCLVTPGFRISTQHGMTLINKEQFANGYEVLTFDMDPLGCGAVYDQSGIQVSAWCEGFKVTVDRSQVIGENKSGADLYPLVLRPDGLGYNDALPAISIEGLAQDFDAKQLNVSCVCDGTRVSIKRANILRNSEEGLRVVSLRLDQSNVPQFVESGNLYVTHEPTGRQVLNYHFSVTPIRKISLESVRNVLSTLVATYSISVESHCELIRGDSVIQPCKEKPAHIEALLSDEFISMVVRPPDENSDTSITAHVFAAGIDVNTPSIEQDYSRRILDRHILEEMTRESGVVTIKSRGRRSHRGVFLSLGLLPCFIKSTLPITSTYKVSPFSPLPDAGPEDGKKPAILTLTISFDNGYRRATEKESSCRVNLISVLLGYGLGTYKLNSDLRESRLVFSQPVDYDLSLRFSRLKNGRENYRQGYFTSSWSHIGFPAVRGLESSCQRFNLTSHAYNKGSIR